MSKTIQTTLTADSTQLRAEYAKAAKATEAYESRVQEAQKRARSQSADQLRALAMEASGRKEAADALRQQIQLAEQARGLAASTGLSDEAALATVRWRLELEERITKQKADTAAAALKQAQAEKAAGTAQQEALRRQQAMEAQNAASVQAALQARAERQQRIQNLPSQGWQALPGGLPALTAQSLSQMEKGVALQKEMRRQTMLAGAAGKNGALGFLAFSQAVEDAQYGIRGVLNNIPQMVMGFGGSAGLAGALSLLAVGSVVAYSGLRKLTGDESLQKWAESGTAALEDYGTAIVRAASETKRLKADEETRFRLSQELAKEQARLSSEIERDESAKRQADEATEATEAWLARVGEMLKAQQALRAAQQAGAGLPVSQQTERFELDEGGRLRALAVQTEILDAQRRINQAAADYNKIWDGIGSNVTRYQVAMAAANAELEPAQKRLRELEAGLAYAEQRLKDARESKVGGGIQRNAQRNRDDLEKQVDATKLLIAAREAEMRQSQELLRQTEEKGAANRKAAEDDLRAQRARLERLTAEKEQLVTLGELQRQQLAEKQKREQEEQKRIREGFDEEGRILAARAAGNERLAESLERQQAIEELKARLMKEQGLSAEQALAAAQKRVDVEQKVADAAERKARSDAKKDFAGEMAVLRFQAAGQERQAQALREEIEARGTAKSLADAMGISERAALEMVRQRQALEDQIEERKARANRPRSAIYKLTAEESAERRRQRMDTISRRSTGLRNSAVDREARARQGPAKERSSAAAYYDRSINAQEAVVKILKGLGVA